MRDDLKRHIERMGMQDPYLRDPTFAATIKLTSQMLTLVEMAMQDEEVDPQVIECVLRRLLYGTISPGWQASIEEVDQIKAEWAKDREMTPVPVWLERRPPEPIKLDFPDAPG